MRYLNLALIILITLAVVTFMVQNVDVVIISFLSSSLTLPLSVLILGIYLLGVFTGGMVASLLRTLVRGAKIRKEPRN